MCFLSISFLAISDKIIANNISQTEPHKWSEAPCEIYDCSCVPVLTNENIFTLNHCGADAVDTIGPWIIPQSPHSSKSKEPITLQALTIIDLNMHLWKSWHWKTSKASPLLAPSTKFGSVATPSQLIVYMTMAQNLSLPNFKNFFNHMEFDPNWPLSKTLKPMVSLNTPIK
jgi:hypothetical protein